MKESLFKRFTPSNQHDLCIERFDKFKQKAAETVTGVYERLLELQNDCERVNIFYDERMWTKQFIDAIESSTLRLQIKAGHDRNMTLELAHEVALANDLECREKEERDRKSTTRERQFNSSTGSAAADKNVSAPKFDSFYTHR